MSLRILLVEDNPDDADLTQSTLAIHAPEALITLVEDGVEALVALGLVPAPVTIPPAATLPDLVLLDLKMPRLDGIEVLTRMRANPVTRRIPVVVFTSSVDETDIARAYDAGANSYLRKPVDFDAFGPLAQQLVRYWLGANWPPPSPAL